MDDADIFHERMMPYGGRADLPSPYWCAFRRLAEQMIEPYGQFMTRMPKVHFDFVSSPLLQALAFTHRGKYFIGVFAGTAYLLDAIFCRMLSDRRVLPGIGNILLEVEEPQTLLGLPLDAEKAFGVGFGLSPPKCPVRQQYKNRLLEMAFRFLVSHEMAHISDGHVDYAAARCSLPLLAELGWTGKTESDTLTRQSLEVIADSQAAGIITDNVPNNLIGEPHPESLQEGVFKSVFSFCVFFRLFGDATFTGDESTQAYPPLRIRQMLCLNMAAQVIKSWPADASSSCLTEVYKAAAAAELTFSILTESLAIQGLQEAFGETGTEYGLKLLKHRDSVTRPALRPFAYHDFDDTRIWRPGEV